MEDNAPYLVVREIEETEFIELYTSGSTEEGKRIEDDNYEVSDSASGWSDEDSDTDFDLLESNWFPSLGRNSIIEYLDDDDSDDESQQMRDTRSPFADMISSVEAIIEESDDSEDEMEDILEEIGYTSRKRSSPGKTVSHRRSKVQKPNSPTSTVAIEVTYVQL
ncbi:hypothetical protein NQZ79_g4752 [Umbelopsis isabellina]|nr:hypothetical protein NQZ79_g4752 [Umbelopsis isabellina]